MIHTVKGFSLINEAEVYVFLEFACFFYDLMDVGNLISGSSAFSKSSLNIWKFLVHVLLKPNLEDFEYYFSSVWDECHCVVVWTFFGVAFFWDWNENWSFPFLFFLFPFWLDLSFSTFQHNARATSLVHTSLVPLGSTFPLLVCTKKVFPLSFLASFPSLTSPTE